MSKTLQDKVAIVTGAASSLGRAIAIAYAHAGAKVVVADLRETSRDPTEGKQSTHQAITEAGGEAVFRKVDVSDEESVNALVQGTVELWGRLDIMVNNAGVALEATKPEPPSIWNMPTDIWDATISINARGTFLGCRAATAQMIKQEPRGERGDRGWIVNMASVYGSVGAPNVAAYVSSKHLVMGLTKAAALDCAPHRIHVNALQPGYLATTLTSGLWESHPEMRAVVEAMHPLPGSAGGLGKPEDVVDAAVFLAGDGARWMTGAGMVVDGGYTAQ